MSHRSPLLLLGAGLLSLGVAAYAQSPAPAPGARAMAGPAKASPVNRAELKSRLEQRFDASDANHDGTVTVEERAAARQAKRTAMRDEMRERVFARLDTDKNGAISKQEFAAAPQRGPGRRGFDGRGPDGRGHGMRGRMHGRMGGEIMRGDYAFNATPVTRKAFVDAGLGRFDRLDTDHDGTISPAERDAGRKAMRDRLAPANRPAPPPPGL